MANKEINDLDAKASPVGTDELEIQETAGGDSKKATLANLLGVSLFAQGVMVDPTFAFGVGIALTEALELQIGL